MSFETSGNDSDDSYQFYLTNNKTFLASTRNYLKALTEGNYGLKDIADISHQICSVQMLDIYLFDSRIL